MTQAVPCRVARRKRIRGRKTSTSLIFRRCAAAICSCLGCDQRQNQSVAPVAAGAVDGFSVMFGRTPPPPSRYLPGCAEDARFALIQHVERCARHAGGGEFRAHHKNHAIHARCEAGDIVRRHHRGGVFVCDDVEPVWLLNLPRPEM